MARGKRPNWKALSVVFETDVQDKEPRFSVPEDICNLLKVGSKDDVEMCVTQAGIEIIHEIRKLVSGVEILHPQLRQGAKITVRVSRLH